MGYRSRQLDKPHAVTTDPAFGNLYAAALADNATMTNPFIFTTMAFPVLRRAKNLLTEKPIHLGLERAVINRFWFGHLTNHLTIRECALPPLHDPLGRSERDLDVIEVVFGAKVAVGHRGVGSAR